MCSAGERRCRVEGVEEEEDGSSSKGRWEQAVFQEAAGV